MTAPVCGRGFGKPSQYVLNDLSYVFVIILALNAIYIHISCPDSIRFVRGDNTAVYCSKLLIEYIFII